MSHTYDIGDQVIFTAVFTNATTGAAIDPAAVFFRIKSPITSTITTYQFGVPPLEIENPSVGTYTVAFAPTEHGVWFYRWYSTGIGMAAAEGRFDVRDSEFD